MSLADELREYAKKTHDSTWSRRSGQKVPSTDDVSLGNDAVDLDAVVLYADLKDSTGLVKGYKDWFASAVYKNYLYTVSRIIRAHDGSITAFDGDRVMGVFIGGSKNSNAAKVALKINWAVKNILQPAIDAKYPKNTYQLQQKVGIAASKTMVSRTGIRGSNDLVWVGNAANIAAKLAALHSSYPTYITADVYNMLSDETKFGGTPKRDMWTDLGSGDGYGKIYGSTFWWSMS
ncbi:adenylate/guanylate cyclase domain-containing protein [Microbacterium aurum]|uniref:Adenylate/guanylate cyclase domain-containing protein n=1 Tax=Microbacterium aurum TaxID=36805 RepID=A0A1P8U864_9MICO|nr:adenylate/guanylate cyclase domain-containing protein [Microbacterium aurum]APZ34286.1 adenylate/guanylate cyclase domain-containing protein [Microbacterium aurum]MBM7828131.1 class 3 adenylate cyclase [Microbacterium aurum]